MVNLGSLATSIKVQRLLRLALSAGQPVQTPPAIINTAASKSFKLSTSELSYHLYSNHQQWAFASLSILSIIVGCPQSFYYDGLNPYGKDFVLFSDNIDYGGSIRIVKINFIIVLELVTVSLCIKF